MKEIILTQGKVALVDDEDYEYLVQWKWYAAKMGNSFYAQRSDYNSLRKQSVITYMHRVILKVADFKIEVDHKDHNGLNNQKENIRAVTKKQNSFNKKSYKNSTSKYVGVSWNRQSNKWQAQVRENGKIKYLGRFINEDDAARAYNKAAVESYGEFANLNTILTL